MILEFEAGLMQLGKLRIDLRTDSSLATKGWRLSGLSVKFEAHPKKQSLFMNQTLNKGQLILRETLCGLRNQIDLETVCLPLVQIINRDAVDCSDQRVT